MMPPMPPAEGEAEGEAPMSEDMDFGQELMQLFDFEEGESEKTKKERLAREISAKFDGAVDDVGFQRIVNDDSGAEMETSRLKIDEYTSPGEVIYAIRRLVEEVRKEYKIPMQYNLEKSSVEQDLQRYEAALRTDALEASDMAKLIELYNRAFRLNRAIVFKECVVVDTTSCGYWRWFAPYFM